MVILEGKISLPVLSDNLRQQPPARPVRRPEDRQRVLDQIKGRIQQTVDGIAAMYGANSEVHRDAQNRISGIRVLSVSARNALDGRLDGDRKMVEDSGILEFEAALSHLLTEERAALDLMKPVHSMTSIAKEARKSIAIRRSALIHMRFFLRQRTYAPSAAAASRLIAMPGRRLRVR